MSTSDDFLIDQDDYDLAYEPEDQLDDLGAAMGEAGAVPDEEGPAEPLPGDGLVARGPTGPDVSDYQPSVNWAKVKGVGHGIAIAKSTEDTFWQSKVFLRRWKAISDVRLIRGAYHFARPVAGRSGRDEALFFLDMVHRAGGFLPGDLRPVLDFEAFKNNQTLPPAKTLRYAYEFAITVKEHVGRLPISYTGVFWREKMQNPANNLGCHLWLAAYTRDPTPWVPIAWKAKGWSVWQHTENGSCPGIDGPCDLNVVRDAATLAKLRLPVEDLP